MSHLPAETGSGGTPRPAPVTTALVGNNVTHSTSAEARKVTVYVHSPDGGPERARPTLDGTPIRGGYGSGKYVIEAPDGWTCESMTVKTRAGNNDVVIVEEF